MKYFKVFGISILLLVINISLPSQELMIESKTLVKPNRLNIKESFVGAYTTYGLASLSGEISDFLSNPSDLGNLIKGNYYLSFGAEYMRKMLRKNKVYWNLGVKMNILKMSIQTEEQIEYHQFKSYDEIVDYDRIVLINKSQTKNENNNFISTDNITINTISIPIGMSYRIDKGQMHTLFVGASLVPSFYLQIKHVFSGIYSREKIIGGIKITKSLKNDNGINVNGFSDYLKGGLTYKSKVSGYALSALLSVKYLYRYRYNQSLALIINYGTAINPILPNATNIFLGEDSTPNMDYNKNTSMTQSIYKDIKSNILSFGIGWCYGFNNRKSLYN